MASQGQPTRAGGAAPPPAPAAAPAGASGIELTTLFLSAIASAAAAYVTSKIWAPGTLFSAAMSPVIVALVKEGLRKPTEAVVNVVPTVVPTPSRWSRTGADQAGLVPEDPAPRPARRRGSAAAPPDAAHPPPRPAGGAGPAAAPPERVDPAAPHVLLPPVGAGDAGPVRVYSTRGRRLRWRLALITGLLGFAICVVLFTVPELIAGSSVGRGSGHATTLFGGPRHHSSSTSTTTSTTQTSTTATTPT